MGNEHKALRRQKKVGCGGGKQGAMTNKEIQLATQK